jgi:hypothetical protein
MTATYYIGDVLEVLPKLPENSVDLILTSPPFLALRSYLPADHPLKSKEGGSQSTPGEYIDWLLDVVEACERVLAPHGSLCLELGDTYSGSGGAGGDYAENGLRAGQPRFRQGYQAIGTDGPHGGPYSESYGDSETWMVQPKGGRGWPLSKSLSLIPETFRWAMVYGMNPFTGRTTDRWRLRNVIRWVRPNPPVGALGDKFRPATSELMVFCKSANRYFDLDSVRDGNYTPRELKVDMNRVDTRDQARKLVGLSSGKLPSDNNPAGAPPLDWWNIPPRGYAGAHYAVWPPELLIRPIKAMCPERVCRTCGRPSERIVAASRIAPADDSTRRKAHAAANPSTGFSTDVPEVGWEYDRATLGWSDCGHDAWRPGLVLDPFAGSGATLAVASGHGRDSIGIDLDERNYSLALERVGPLVLQRGEVAA